MILNGRILTTVAMLAIFAGMSAMALTYPEKARFLPLLISVPATKDTAEATMEHPREAKMFFWLALFFIGIISFGFLYAAPVLVFAFLRFGEKEPWVTAILGGFGAWIILYGAFTRLLELFLFEGFLTRLLIG
jgi:hypothetical protein